jgi:hypothetical protein
MSLGIWNVVYCVPTPSPDSTPCANSILILFNSTNDVHNLFSEGGGRDCYSECQMKVSRCSDNLPGIARISCCYAMTARWINLPDQSLGKDSVNTFPRKLISTSTVFGISLGNRP